MIVVILAFGVPFVVAAVMLSPPGLEYILRGTVPYTGMLLLLMPFLAWPTFFAQSTGLGRLRVFMSFWFGGAVLGTAAISFFAAALDYSPTPVGFDPAGHRIIPYSPQSGLLLGAFAICMLLSMGFWGAVARVTPNDFMVRAAITTGLLLFGAVAGVGYVLWP